MRNLRKQNLIETAVKKILPLRNQFLPEEEHIKSTLKILYTIIFSRANHYRSINISFSISLYNLVISIILKKWKDKNTKLYIFCAKNSFIYFCCIILLTSCLANQIFEICHLKNIFEVSTNLSVMFIKGN